MRQETFLSSYRESSARGLNPRLISLGLRSALGGNLSHISEDFRPAQSRGAENRTRTTNTLHPPKFLFLRATGNRTQTTRPPALRTTTIRWPDKTLAGKCVHTATILHPDSARELYRWRSDYTVTFCSRKGQALRVNLQNHPT